MLNECMMVDLRGILKASLRSKVILLVPFHGDRTVPPGRRAGRSVPGSVMALRWARRRSGRPGAGRGRLAQD